MTRKYCIVGSQGCAREVLCCLVDILAYRGTSTAKDIVFMEHDNYQGSPEVMGIPVIKDSDFDPDKYEVIIGIGEPSQRKKIAERLAPNTKYATLIHPSSIVSEWVKIGKGSIITAGVIITCQVELGNHSHINLQTTISHGTRAGDFFTTAPAVNISGDCIIGDQVYIGTNAALRQGISVSDNVTIGMGAVVVKDIKESGIYIGNPAIRLEKKQKNDPK